jgi:hypothetical protein
MMTDLLALSELAQAIDREHQAAHAAARTALQHALECGRLLLQAKAALPHGQWLPWLEANTSVTARQSQKYMRLATAVLEGKYEATSHLSIEGALEALATPRTLPSPPDRTDYLPRELAPIPQLGEGLVADFVVTNPPFSPNWLEHRVAHAAVVIEPTTVPGYVWPAVVCASLPGAKWKDDERPAPDRKPILAACRA